MSEQPPVYNDGRHGDGAKDKDAFTLMAEIEAELERLRGAAVFDTDPLMALISQLAQQAYDRGLTVATQTWAAWVVEMWDNPEDAAYDNV